MFVNDDMECKILSQVLHTVFLIHVVTIMVIDSCSRPSVPPNEQPVSLDGHIRNHYTIRHRAFKYITSIDVEFKQLGKHSLGE